MSSIEERLVADIAAVTRGVDMTESDLRDARNKVEERIDSARARDRRRTVVAAAAAAAAIPIVGFAAVQVLGGDGKSAPPANEPDADFLTGLAPTAELVDGVWRVDNGTLLMLFNIDGTMQYDTSGTLYASPAVTGTYEIDGDLITVSIGSGPAECVGQEFAMRASLPTLGEMRVVHTQPAIASCSPGQEKQWVLEHVVPTNNEFLSGLTLPEQGDWQPPTGPQSLYGDWMADTNELMVQLNDGGFVLELAPDGTYVFATTGDIAGPEVAVVNRGTWTLSGARITFVTEGGPDNPVTGEPVCDQGERFVMSAVAVLDSGSSYAMRGSFDDEACASRWAPTTWFRLPHDGT